MISKEEFWKTYGMVTPEDLKKTKEYSEEIVKRYSRLIKSHQQILDYVDEKLCVAKVEKTAINVNLTIDELHVINAVLDWYMTMQLKMCTINGYYVGDLQNKLGNELTKIGKTK